MKINKPIIASHAPNSLEHVLEGADVFQDGKPDHEVEMSRRKAQGRSIHALKARAIILARQEGGVMIDGSDMPCAICKASLRHLAFEITADLEDSLPDKPDFTIQKPDLPLGPRPQS